MVVHLMANLNLLNIFNSPANRNTKMENLEENMIISLSDYLHDLHRATPHPALPLAAGINLGGHYFWYIIPLGVVGVVVVLLPPLLKSQKGLS